MKAQWKGKVVAQSDQTLNVGGYTYFPRSSVRMEFLAPATKDEDDLD